MRQRQLMQLLYSSISLLVFVLSSELADALSTQRNYQYTSFWGDTFWSFIVTLLVTFPAFIACIGFVVAAIISEIKIYNNKRAKKL
jgi:hypothetical protein